MNLEQIADGLYQCTKCRAFKPDGDFYRSTRDGRQRWCKRCVAEGVKARYHAGPGKETNRRSSRRRRYGLTPADYELLLEQQHGLCAICLEPPSGRGRKGSVLCVDHDHKTGAVRGLLCHNCNRAIGALKDDRRLVASALAYLYQGPGWKQLQVALGERTLLFTRAQETLF